MGFTLPVYDCVQLCCACFSESFQSGVQILPMYMWYVSSQLTILLLLKLFPSQEAVLHACMGCICMVTLGAETKTTGIIANGSTLTSTSSLLHQSCRQGLYFIISAMVMIESLYSKG